MHKQEYSVYYKTTNQFFWRKIKNVIGDVKLDSHTIGSGNKSLAFDCPMLELIKSNNEVIRLPMDGLLIKFSKERFDAIKKNMEAESGQKLNI